MTAQVIEFSQAAARHTRGRPATADVVRDVVHDVVRRDLPGGMPDNGHQFAFWTGASGRRYVHTIYSLLWCPELPNANVVLARIGVDGRREAVKVCRVENDATSLNLAEIRHQGALLGACEVHVHLLGDSPAQRGFIELDLAAAAETADAMRSARG